MSGVLEKQEPGGPRLTRIAVCLPYEERAARALVEVPESDEDKTVTTRLQDASRRRAWTRLALRGVRRIVNALPSRTAKLWAMHLEKLALSSIGSPDLSGVDALIAFPGASRRLFRENPNVLKVLHCVDAHPRTHNEALASLSRRERRAELYPAWLVRQIEREISLADVLLVPSYLVAHQMKQNGVAAQKILVVPYAADTERFAYRPGEPEEAAPRPVSILYVGQVSQRKNVRTLIDASRGATTQLVVAGNIFDRSQIDNPPPNVHIVGPLDRESLADAYRRADAFAIASLEDACSLVALEAAVSGLPILLTKENGAEEILPPEQKTMIDARDVAAWRNAFRSLEPLGPAHREQLSAAAIGNVSDWGAYAHRVRVALAARVERSER